MHNFSNMVMLCVLLIALFYHFFGAPPAQFQLFLHLFLLCVQCAVHVVHSFVLFTYYLVMRSTIFGLLVFCYLGVASTCYAIPNGESCRIDSIAADIRGGDIVNSIDGKTLTVIKQFLSESSTDRQNDEFLIQGWRWHCMSLIRDADRLERLAAHLSSNKVNDDSGLEALLSAADYTVNFNMAGLYRIESTMFVKWLRKHLCNADAFGDRTNAAAMATAFVKVIDKIDSQRVDCEKIGKELYDNAMLSSRSSITTEQRQRYLREVVRLSTRLSDELHSMRDLQEMLVVPSISRLVSASEQKSFNNKVLLALGLLESRVHLVGMHDAVWESGSDIEKQKFEKEIPYVARIMIERWRKSLYKPKGAWALDYVVTDNK